METSAPVQQRPHGAAPTPTRRQRQAELRARELAAAGLEGRAHTDSLHVEHRHTAPRPATFAVPQVAAPPAPVEPSLSVPAHFAGAHQAPAPASPAVSPAVSPAAAARAMAPVEAPVAAQPAAPRVSPFPPTGIQRATEPVAPLQTPSGEIPVVLVPAPTPLRSTPTPVVAAPQSPVVEPASYDAATVEHPFAPLTRRERKTGGPATGPTPVVATAAPTRGPLFGSKFVARAATGAAFVGALACVPLVLPSTASGDFAPGGMRTDLADDEAGDTTTELAQQEVDAEEQLLSQAQDLLTRADGPAADRATSPQDLADAKAELAALTESLIAERAQGTDRASRSSERTALTTETAAEVDTEAAAPATSEDVARAANRVAVLLQDFGETGASGVTPAPATPGELAAERRVRAANLLAQCGSTNYANGKIPASALTTLSFARSHMLRCDAAAMLEELSAAYQQRFGEPIGLTDSYRSYASQVATRAAKPGLAAVPGTSNHGWGLAIDLTSPASNPGSAQYKWLRANAPLYGWDNPAWARTNGSKPEPWHFEYASGW
ncbi:D-alanyl-D-alanine carboxypeptidase family protein [Oerskovia merdavium]|uniref:D-alanyl-D-alanine carboxypeptidase family protein n=1 Tax=Oerskovia merdavium TaxID=2762227 RepID=A0ABR8TUZ7_9CELL|nr:D-alanyl-D-alanine carboxypeptidase family protein [Oerskovia merdavium]MBD7979592.1 D-alanyl-D-alanine carboxypeptidase family protein [Oerskovia merdavium]